MPITGTIVDCEQGDSAWMKAKTGRVSSSRIYEVIAKRKKSPDELACRRNLRIEMVGEILTGDMAEHYVSWYMKEGKENEPRARTAYEIDTDSIVDTVGFIIHPTIERAGSSPDGLCGEDGIVEFKAPKLSTHIEYILAGTIPEEYLPQCMWHLACTGRAWCDFVSFHYAMPEPYHLFIRRLFRDELLIAAMELEVIQFLKEVDQSIERLKSQLKMSSVLA
jgi:YqaJ-like recombinase protein